MNGVLKKLLGDPQAKTIKRLRKRVKLVNDLAPKYEKMKDKDLQKQTEVLRKRLKKESLDAILPDAFAIARAGVSFPGADYRSYQSRPLICIRP
jgi:preprotein translocase subunit SecA